MLVALLLAIAAKAGPIFLGAATAGAEARPPLVMAGQKKEFVLTLTSGETEAPELSGDLAAIAGSLAAPIFSNRALVLHRMGEARAGVQRFKFEVDIPAAERKQDLLLRLKIRSRATVDWLPLPRINLEASPRSWPDALRRFARQVPTGRLAGSAGLAELFRRAEIETPETTEEEMATTESVRVWFAEATGDELRIPKTPRAVWLVFKRNVRDGLEIRRPTPFSPPCIVVDVSALVAPDTDAAAQDLFERALATALALTLSSPDSIQSSP